MARFTIKFKDINLQDLAEVGGKNAFLGEMYSSLRTKGVLVPDGFATTAFAFWAFLDHNKLWEPLLWLMNSLDKEHYKNLSDVSKQAKALIMKGAMPDYIADEIKVAYRELGKGKQVAVVVRSSNTAADFTNTSFAGLHASFVNIAGWDDLLLSIQKCFASLYTERAIKYRDELHSAHEQMAISVGVQLMVRADLACSGVACTIEPESGFKDVVYLSGVWGLGEGLAHGRTTPDEWIVFKPSLVQGRMSILQKTLGRKHKTFVYPDASIKTSTISVDTAEQKGHQFVLSDDEITQLAQRCFTIENHFDQPLYIEWAKDGLNGKLYIIQARPETGHSKDVRTSFKEFRLLEKGDLITQGQAIGSKIVTGKARILTAPKEADSFNDGEILVTEYNSPAWDIVLKRAAAIITNEGGRTSDAAIIARESGIPAIVGCGNATIVIKDGDLITVSCCEGRTGHVYKGLLSYTQHNIPVGQLHKFATTEIMLAASSPDRAFQLSMLPADGVGSLRLKEIITRDIGIHPMALVKYHELDGGSLKFRIDTITNHCPDKKQFFIEKLSEGIALFAAAFFPKDVVVRLSDFNTDEYWKLLGGDFSEMDEEDPMRSYKGACCYYNILYRDVFALECAAIRRAREEMGLQNIKVMVPFCRSINEAKKVLREMADHGLDRNRYHSLQVFMEVCVPGHVLLAEKHARLFNGFVVDTDCLAQLTPGVDNSSSLVRSMFDEMDEAVKMMIEDIVRETKKAGIHLGVCGHAASADAEFAKFLVQAGVNSVCFVPEDLLNGIANIREAEETLSKTPDEEAEKEKIDEKALL